MRRYFFPMVLGSILIGAGIVLSIFEFSFFTYHDYLPEGSIIENQEARYYAIDQKDLYLKIKDINYQILYNDTLVDQALVTFNYYPSLYTLKKEETKTNNYREVKVAFKLKLNQENFYKELYNILVRDLKNKEIHNYGLFFKPNLNIQINPNDIDSIKVIKY